MKDDLIHALGECKRPATCHCITKSSYESTNNKHFCIFDEGETSQNPIRMVVDESLSHQLTVHNETQKEIHVVKVDKCLLTDSIQKCDCAIFDEANTYLVEIKTSNSGNRGNRRRAAINQLESTIQLLQSHNIQIDKHNTTALICFKTMVPKIIQASRSSKQAEFKAKYNISLEEGNTIYFK